MVGYVLRLFSRVAATRAGQASSHPLPDLRFSLRRRLHERVDDRPVQRALGRRHDDLLGLAPLRDRAALLLEDADEAPLPGELLALGRRGLLAEPLLRGLDALEVAPALGRGGGAVARLSCQLRVVFGLDLGLWKSTSESGALSHFPALAVLARSSGEEPASPRHRAGVASMA